MPESGARSVKEGAGKRCSECEGRCQKAMLGVCRTVPESGARSVQDDAGKRCSECGLPREISATVRRERMEVMTSDLFGSRAVVLTHVWG